MNGETRDSSPPAIRSAYGISGGVTMQLVVSAAVSRQPHGRCLAWDVLLPPLYDQIDRRCSRAGAGGVRGTGANADPNGAAANRHPRSAARPDRALSGSAARADVDE